MGSLSHLARSSGEIDRRRGISKILNVADFWEGGEGESGGSTIGLLGSAAILD
jgi:hypothetical protein